MPHTLSYGTTYHRPLPLDLAMSGMDDYSDQSSIISSDVISQRLSTFARSLTRPIPSSTSTYSHFGNLSSSHIPMPFVRSHRRPSLSKLNFPLSELGPEPMQIDLRLSLHGIE